MSKERKWMKYQNVYQSSRWTPVISPKIRKTLFGRINFSVFIYKYIHKINSRIWFGPVNSNVHFENWFILLFSSISLCDTTFKTSLYLQACLKTPEEKSETVVHKRQTIQWPKEQGQKDILWSTKYYQSIQTTFLSIKQSNGRTVILYTITHFDLAFRG